MPIQYLEAQPPDYHAIAEIYNEHIALHQSTMDEHHYMAGDIKTWIRRFNTREKLYVIHLDHTIIGWGIIKRYSDRLGYRYAAETAIYLREKHTGQGHGSRFKKFVIEQAKNLQYHHLVAKIFASNRRSIDYNLSLGYTIVGIQKEIGFKNGQWQDICIMQLLLN